MNIAIVTGASSGMGREFVLQIAKRYPKLNEIWVVARRKEKLMELAEETGANLRIFDLDLCKPEDFAELQNALEYDKPNVRMLVNSAGAGFLSNFTDTDSAHWESLIDLNCKVLTKVTHTVLPYMKKGARILQLASAAAFVPQPGFNVYAASKAYVLSFSRALAQELTERGITVTAVCPGPVKTEFFQVADPDNQTKFFKKLMMAAPQKVVKKALNDAKIGKEISVYGMGMKAFALITKILPHKIFIKIMGYS